MHLQQEANSCWKRKGIPWYHRQGSHVHRLRAQSHTHMYTKNKRHKASPSFYRLLLAIQAIWNSAHDNHLLLFFLFSLRLLFLPNTQHSKVYISVCCTQTRCADIEHRELCSLNTFSFVKNVKKLARLSFLSMKLTHNHTVFILFSSFLLIYSLSNTCCL